MASAKNNKLSASLEDYLEAIFNLAGESNVARSKDIAKLLGVSKSSVTGAYNGIVKLWDVATGQQCTSLLRHGAVVWAVAYSPDGNILATASGEGGRNVRLWDVGGGPPYYSFALPSRAISGKEALESFSSDGTLLVRRLPEGKARVLRLPSAPTDIREMQLQTWVALGAQRNDQGQVIPIPWEYWQKLREELRSLLGEAETSDEYYVPIQLEPDCKEAEELMLIEKLDIQRRLLGGEHPGTLGTVNKLIKLYRDWGKMDQAERKQNLDSNQAE